MRAISSVAVLALIPICAVADPAQPPSAPVDAGPVTISHPPVPAELAPANPDFQAAMANSQLQTYRYNQLTEQALALKKLCDTGFGPSDICPAAGAGPTAGKAGSFAEAELPTVAAIDGAGGALTAVLVMSDGRRIAVRPGTVLPGGLTVSAISGEDVRVRSLPGREQRLAFGEGIAR